MKNKIEHSLLHRVLSGMNANRVVLYHCNREYLKRLRDTIGKYLGPYGDSRGF